jgi:hypothetical protein
MKVICIDSTNRPNEIPATHWVEEGKIYTVIQTDKLLGHSGKIGFKLEEINIDRFAPYQYFDSARFNPYIGPVEVSLKEEESIAA